MTEKMEPFWALPPLAPEDEKLRDAYVQLGRPVDQLPYSEAFDKLMALLGEKDTREGRYNVFQRLLLLRKRGRLPRVNRLTEAI